MTEYFIRYRQNPLAEIGRMQGPDGTMSAQQLVNGEALIEIRAEDYGLALTDQPVEVVRATLWNRVKAQRAAVRDGGAVTPLGSVDSQENEDVPARTNILGTTLAATIAKMNGADFSVTWTMLDNSEQIFDANQMIAVGLAVLAHVGACYDRARELRAQIDAAENIEALLAIDIMSGWPG